MTSPLDRTVGRRQFLTGTALGALTVAGVASTRDAAAHAEDQPNTHNMLVVGERTLFLSHLPMFDGLDKTKTAFRSPHRYQLLVEATFTNQGKDVTNLYFKDRQSHPDTRIYTLNPEEFVITRLFTPREQPRLTAFNAMVFRGHLEQGGKPIPGLEKTSVKAIRIVHGRMLEPQTKKPTELEYILFGKGTELYLAHAIFAAPDFDHVLSVKSLGRELTDKELAQDVRVIVRDRKNLAADRLREKQRVEATLRTGPSGSSASKVQIEAGDELYFEEGELLVPPTFEPTSEEKKR